MFEKNSRRVHRSHNSINKGYAHWFNEFKLWFFLRLRADSVNKVHKGEIRKERSHNLGGSEFFGDFLH